MLQLQTNTEAYWLEGFALNQTDLEFIYNLFLEAEKPLSTPELIRKLIDFRIDNEISSLRKQLQKEALYQPANAYALEQRLTFATPQLSSATVIDKREGNNPEVGAFTVVKVRFEDGLEREYASEVKTEHKLNDAFSADNLTELRPKAAKIYERYKRILTPIVVDSLREQEDTVFIAKRWFLKSLLLEVNIAHLHLAEAILDINNGGPISTEEIADQADFGEDENPVLRRFSLDYGLSHDDRFDEVGPAGRVMWFLKRMQPAQILTVPRLLHYQELSYNPDVLAEELLDIEEAIDDELSDYEITLDDDAAEATLSLIYPHLRMGTLPLSQRVEPIFPIAYRTPRIRITLIDAKTGDEMSAWVVRDFGYVYGLKDFYERHHIPIGGQISVRPTEDDDTRILINYDDHKPRNEYVWLAQSRDNRLRFIEGQQQIGTRFDDLLLLGVEDRDALDTLSERYQNRDLPTLMTDILGGLAQFSPQRHVHCKTIYSAVNLMRRCPPGPIFATLCTHSNFEHTGGPYWRLA